MGGSRQAQGSGAGAPPFLSLIVSTIGRVAELRRLCESLTRQTCLDFELIIIDQSENSAALAVFDEFKHQLSIFYARSRRGLSHGRNIGMAAARGDTIGFPDDDCWYRPDIVERVRTFFLAHPDIHILTGAAADEDGNPLGRAPSSSGRVTRQNVWTRGISIAIFMRREVTDQVGNFNETLGVGAGTPIGSGEETDLLLRAIAEGFIAYCDRDLIIHHVVPDRGRMKPERAFSYGIGMGYLIRHHRLGMRALAMALVRPVGGSLLALWAGNRGLAAYYWASLRGRWKGFCMARRSEK